ncbi:MAG: IPTL-CTERM sorting domain-containing protein [Acidobacteriota bacterium]
MAFAQVTDDAQITIDDPSIGKTREDTSPDPDTLDSTVQIGELIEYQVVVTVPAGTSASANLNDRLDAGLVISSVDGVTLGSDITSSVGNEAAILAGAVVSNGGRDLDISFGTVTNAATDNADRTITIDYTAIVTDSGANVAGANRNNRARWEWDGVFLQANAPNTLVVEPAITILKTANPTNGDEGDVVTFTVALSVSGGIAFDVTVADTISDPNLVFIPGSVTAAGGTVTTGNGGGDSTIQVDYASLASGANVSITYQASIAVGVVSGSTLNNTAGVSWDSLPGNPTGTQRSYGPVTDDATVSVDSPTMLKTVIATSEASTGTSQGGTEDDLTIGETVTYRLTVTVPEGTSNQILIRDSLPASAQAVLEYVSASVFDVGMNLTATIPNPTPVVQDLNLGDGRNDTVELDFGTVTNAGDMAVTNEDRIFVDVVARVVDVPANAGGDTATNTGLVQFGAGLNATDTAVVDLVEPVLQIDKSSPTTTGDAGDTVRFTLTMQHAGSSTADAFDLALSDTLPAGLNFVSFPAGGTCDVPPTTGPAESAGTITASWDSFPLTPGGQICEILIDVTIDNSVTPGQSINNQATLDWDSLPADPGVEERSSSTNDNHIVTISSPGVNKTVFATSEGSTGTAISGPEPDLTIGETVTYRFTVTIPEGTAPNVNVTDQLPTGIAVLAVESSQLVSIGNRISGPGLPALGTAGTASDTNVDTFDDNVAWSLGDLFNNPDGAQNGGDQIVFEVVARVVDDALNTSADDDLVNTATFTFTGGSANGTALVDLVEPELALDKRPTPDPAFIDAGDTITFELQIDHTVSSTADAFSLEITDVLANPGTTWAGNVATDCPSLSTNATAAPTIVFTLPTLTLATDTCTISYDVTIDNTVSPGQTLTNTASLQYDSQPTFTSGETRRRTTGDMASATVLAPTLVKLTSMTSLSDTMQSQYVGGVEDLAIGETVDYTLTVLFPEGVTDNAVVVDTLPVGAAGILEAIGASITSIGTRISTSLAGTPTLSDVLGSDGLDDTVSFDFGTVTNTPDNVADAGDRITLLITARVINDPRNADGDNLTNDAALTYATGPPVTDSADVDVVEPDMGLTKSLGAASNGTIVSTISLTNNGTAPAYDVLIVDVLDDSVWDLGSFAPITVPAGYLMSTAAGPGAGQLTVSLSSDGGAAPPLSSVEPSETVQWQFSLRLATPQPPSPVSNTATNTLATTLPGNDPNERDQPDVPATDMLDLPILDATKADTLVIDDNASGGASPGETIRYTLQITNSGSAAATNVVVDDTPGINTTLVAGSVVAPGGTVVTGNTGGDTAVQVTFASVPVGTVTVTFDVLIDSPFPNGVTQIANQAMIGSNELPDFPSDDPDTPATDDPTVTPVDAAPDLTINKDDGGITTAPGGLVSYTLNYSNVGTQVAVASVLTDTVPVGSTFDAAASTAGWVCLPDTSAGSTCTLTLGNLAASANGSATFAVTVDDPLASGIEQLDNTAQIADDGSNGADPTPGNNTNSDTTPITADVDLQISKDDGGVSTTPGSTLVYTLDYANVGDQTATGALITETVPDHTTFNAAASTAGWSCVAVTAGSACSFTVGTLAGNGAGGSIDFALDVDDPLPSTVTQIDNGATIGDDGANGPDLTLGDNSDSDFTPVNADVDLRLTKTDGVTTAAPGDLLVYGIDFENAGSQSATGVVLTETVPEHTTFDAGSSTAGWICAPDGSAGSTCTLAIGAVAGSGGGGSADFAVRVDNPVPGSATQIANAVQIADDGSNGPDPTPVDNSAADTDTLERTPVLEVTKTDALLIDADTSLDATPGDTLRYTVVVSLTGDSGTLGASFTDAPGANTSLVAGSVITTLGTITSGNSGGDTTVAVDLGDLLSPTTATITFDVTIDDPLVPAGTTQIVNQGSAQSADEPGEPSDDPDTGGDDDPTITPIGTTPVLDVTKADGLLIDADTSLDVSLGDTLRYTVELTNTGLGDATGVTLTDTPDASSSLVAGTVTTTQGSVTLGNSGGDTTVEVDLGTLGAGATATVTFDVSVDAVPPSGFLRNQGITRSNELPDEPSDDPDTPNDDDPTDTPVGTQPLVEAVKTDLLAVDADGDGSVGPGDTLRFVVTLENTGAADANGARFRDTPGANTTLVATTVQTSQGTVTTGNGAGDGTVDVDLGTLPAGAQATVAFDVLIDSPLPAGVVQVANQGTVSVDTLPDEPTDDPDTPGDDDPTTTPVGPMPELEVSKADQLLIDADTSSSVTPGDTLRYTLIVESVGTGGAQDVELNDAPGANTTLVAGSVTTSLGTVTEGNTLGDTTVRVDLGTLPTGTMATITFDVTIAAVLVPSTTSAVANQALVTSSNAPDEPSDDPDTASDDDPTVTPLGSGPALDALKSDTLVTDADASGGLTAGDTLEYRVEISNFGGGVANAVVFEDGPVANATLVVGSVTTTVGTVTTGNAGGDTTVTVDLGALAGGSSATVTFQVLLDLPLPAGVTEIVNQGTVRSTNHPDTPTDDPDTVAADDPTRTPIAGSPALDSTKQDFLRLDTDGNSALSPGDTQRYVLEVTNTSATQATGVRVIDMPDALTSLINGTVAASQGLVLEGNGAGDSRIVVALGAVPGNSQATITYDVVLDGVFPPGSTTLRNQGTVESDQLPDVPTDDPDTPTPDDPTMTPVTLTPTLQSTKVVDLEDDVDASRSTTPGDVLRYTVDITSGGDAGLTNVTFDDAPDTNTQLVVGSVTTSQGVVVVGNSGTDSTISVTIGSMPSGTTATIVYDVRINDPLVPVDTTELVNQGVLRSTELPDVLTDDPGTASPGDPTTTIVVSNLYAVPTLGEWALILFAAFLAALGTLWLRRGA